MTRTINVALGLGDAFSDPGGGDFSHWNEPAGYTSLVEQSFTTLPPSDAAGPEAQHGEQGYTVINALGAGNYALLTSAGDPATGSDNAIRLTYPSGFPNGSAPGTINYKSHENANDFLEFDGLYVQRTIRIVGGNGSSFENQTVGTKIGFKGHGRNPVTRGSNQLYIMLTNNSGDMEDTTSIDRVELFQQNVASRRVSPADCGLADVPIDVGTWYTFEELLEIDSAPDAGDGRYRLWITNHDTGVRSLALDVTDMTYRTNTLDANDGVPMTHRLHPVAHDSWTWGGGGDDVKTRDDYIDTGYVYISGIGGS